MIACLGLPNLRDMSYHPMMTKSKTTKKAAAKTAPAPSLLPSRHDLSVKQREKLVRLLEPILAAELDLISQCQQAHWNVRGPRFLTLHELFDKLAALVEPFVDDTAERAAALGGLVHGTLRAAAAASPLPEPPASSDEAVILTSLRDSFAIAAAHARAAVDAADDRGDTGTADLLTGLSRALDQGLWFLDAHLG